MENIETTAKKVADNIRNQGMFYRHFNLLICGENSYGKSTLIKSIVQNVKSSCEVYYIDPQNRQICDLDNLAGKPLDSMTIGAIVNNRFQEANYLKKDVFEERTNGPAVVYTAIENSVEKYNDLFWDYFGITIKKEEDVHDVQMPVILINDRTEIYDVSSSQAARMRLLLEIDFAVTKGAKVVFIDEFDEFLTDRTAAKFLTMLHEKYDKIAFVVSVQNLSLIMRMNDFDIAIICKSGGELTEDNLVRFVDSDSITEIGQIEKIRELIGKRGQTSNLEEMVCRIVDTGKIEENDKHYIDTVKRDELSGRDKILFDYVLRMVKA